MKIKRIDIFDLTEMLKRKYPKTFEVYLKWLEDKKLKGGE
jgi:hypothetical protein